MVHELVRYMKSSEILNEQKLHLLS